VLRNRWANKFELRSSSLQIFQTPFPFHTFSNTVLFHREPRKDAKKVHKLEAQIPYHEGRGNKDEVEKIKQQIDAIWTKTREAALAM
jgi:hypothetical protein